jgi:hypothetical protein
MQILTPLRFVIYLNDNVTQMPSTGGFGCTGCLLTLKATRLRTAVTGAESGGKNTGAAVCVRDRVVPIHHTRGNFQGGRGVSVHIPAASFSGI